MLSSSYAATTVGAFSLIAFSAFEALAVTTVMPTVARELDGVGLYALAFAAPLASGVIGIDEVDHVRAGHVGTGDPAGALGHAWVEEEADAGL